MAIPQAHSFALGAVQFWGSSYEIMVHEEGTIVPPFSSPVLTVDKLVAANGSIANGTHWHAQEIVLACAICDTPSTIETKLTNVWAALKAHHEANAEELLVVQAWATRQYYARLSAIGDVVESISGAEFTLTFLATNPRV